MRVVKNVALWFHCFIFTRYIWASVEKFVATNFFCRLFRPIC